MTPPAQETYICRCESLTEAEIHAVIAEGNRTANDVKRRTRCGMGLCQGIYCIPTLLQMLARIEEVDVTEIAPMTQRSPVRPIPLETLADFAETLEGR